ncbi:hypothetical protein FK535_08150 [Mycolicibacterium sp. 018/SC-01/001]|uniref:hypothetical protein n=1 Tax=Mycolicibacterium sp. 018/SC-01/001 TaxID=2592069 RepID=UPI00117F4EE8|nr:hypothetical protein [Mycolicibacterium sp. 018/SC-01/001]TRW85372.1 hypothetical protein FK535_08150 [Mycolicibacterium sp. 018/SC-01/001]
MALDKHVGRVGALAVALGIGSAVVAVPAVAWAEPDAGSTAAVSHDSGDSPRERGPLGGKRARPAATADSDGPAATRRSQRDGRVGRTHSAAERDAQDGRPAVRQSDDDDSVDESAGQPKTSVGSGGRGRTATDGTEPTAWRIPNRSSSSGPTMLATLFAPRTSPDHTDAPATPSSDSPLMWTMLAAARRQFGELRDGAASAQTTHSTATSTASSTDVPGLATQPVVIGADGTIYQVTVEANANTGMLAGGTRVSIVGPDGTTRTTRTLVGGPSEGSDAVAREDGSLLITTYSRLLNRTFVSVVNPNGLVRQVGSASGNVQAPITIAPNGTAYVQTLVNPSFGLGYKLIRISDRNTVRVYSTTVSSFPPAVAPDGSAYLVSQNLFTDNVVLMAIGPDGALRRTAPRSDAQVVGQPVIGTDGRAYWTVGYDTSDKERVADVYTFTGNKATIRHIDGDVSNYTLVPSGDGVYIPVVDNVTGATAIARISATAIDLSDSVNGYLVRPIDVTPDGTVYASLYDYGTKTYSVGVYRPDGSVSAIDIDGEIVQPGYPRPPTENFPTTSSDNTGYVAYTAGGHTYVVVVSPDGTIARTVALPDGTAVTRPVTFDADGNAYQVVETPGSTAGNSVSVVSLATGAVIATRPGSLVTGHDSLQFGPDGTGYLVTAETSGSTYHIVSFDSTGAVLASLDAGGFLARDRVDYWGQGYFNEPLTFGPDGTAYVSLSEFLGQAGGVYALTPEGASKILSDDEPDTSLTAVIVSDAGIPYVTVTRQEGDRYVSTVTALTA